MGVYEKIFSANFIINNMDDITYIKRILDRYGRNNPSRRITLGERVFSKMDSLDVFEYEYSFNGCRKHIFFNGTEVFIDLGLKPYAFVVSVIHDGIDSLEAYCNSDVGELFDASRYYFTRELNNPIKRVIFNNPATIVIWKDGSKTVVKCQDGDTFDPEKGLAMAISRKFLGDTYDYYDVFEKWLSKESLLIKSQVLFEEI